MNAAVTVYTDEAAFIDALASGSYFTETFDGESGGATGSLNFAQDPFAFNVAPVSPGIGSNIYVYTVQGTAGDVAFSASSLSAVTPVIVAFSGTEPVTAFGGYFIGSDVSGNTVSASVNLTAVIGGSTYTAPVITTPSSAPVFRGYITDSGSFNSFTFDDPAADLWGGLSSITVGIAVPEPCTTLLTSAAGVGLLLRRRRI